MTNYICVKFTDIKTSISEELLWLFFTLFLFLLFLFVFIIFILLGQT